MASSSINLSLGKTSLAVLGLHASLFLVDVSQILQLPEPMLVCKSVMETTEGCNRILVSNLCGAESKY